MRLLLLALLLVGCSSKHFIGPDGDGGAIDASADVVTTSDGAAPDGGNAGDQSFQSGSRIKVRYIVSSDGAQQAIGFFDSQRNENCGFVLASDSVTRCMTAAAATYGPGTFYGDANCTTPLLAFYAGCQVPATARVTTTSSSCGDSKYDAMNVGAAYAGANVWLKSGSTCTSSVIATTWAYLAFFQTGTLVPPASFQDATTITK